MNGTDASQVLRHYASLSNTINDPVRDSAADVNLTHYINGTDAAKIEQRYIGSVSTFARGDWTFAKPTGGDLVTIYGSKVTQDFKGLCVGDVNGTNVPLTGSLKPGKITVEHLTSVTVHPGMEFEIPLKTTIRLALNAVTLVIPFDKHYIMVTGVTFGAKNALYKITGDEVRFIWAGLNPWTLKSGEALITLRCRVNEQFKGKMTLELKPSGESELVDESAKVIPMVKLKSVVIKPVSNH